MPDGPVAEAKKFFPRILGLMSRQRGLLRPATSQPSQIARVYPLVGLPDAFREGVD